jgi:hypothetical protein
VRDGVTNPVPREVFARLGEVVPGKMTGKTSALFCYFAVFSDRLLAASLPYGAILLPLTEKPKVNV